MHITDHNHGHTMKISQLIQSLQISKIYIHITLTTIIMFEETMILMMIEVIIENSLHDN